MRDQSKDDGEILKNLYASLARISRSGDAAEGDHVLLSLIALGNLHPDHGFNRLHTD
jgi:hypothetical protein